MYGPRRPNPAQQAAAHAADRWGDMLEYEWWQHHHSMPQPTAPVCWCGTRKTLRANTTVIAPIYVCPHRFRQDHRNRNLAGAR